MQIYLARHISWLRFVCKPQYLLSAEVHTLVHRHIGHGLAGRQSDGDIVRLAEAAPEYCTAICRESKPIRLSLLTFF